MRKRSMKGRLAREDEEKMEKQNEEEEELKSRRTRCGRQLKEGRKEEQEMEENVGRGREARRKRGGGIVKK